MHKFLFFIPVLFCISANAQNQRQLVSNFGGTLTGNAYTMSFALGEVAVETFSSGNLILHQGFFQGQSMITAVSQNPVETDFLVYPNPFQNELRFSVKGGSESGSFQIILRNALGQVIQSTAIDATDLNHYILSTESLNSGIYLITLISDKSSSKYSFKIIKQS